LSCSTKNVGVPWRYLKMSVIADGSSGSGLSQPASKYFSQFLAHGRP
jgi:hypothetical protein